MGMAIRTPGETGKAAVQLAKGRWAGPRGGARLGAAAGLAAALLAAGAARAQQSVAAADARADEGAIKYRQSLMDSIGGDMGALATLLKYQMPLTNAAVHANSLVQHAGLISFAFERKVTAGPTDAKPAIWEKQDAFEQAVEKFHTEVNKLADVASTDDREALAVQLKATGKACGNCHDNFRKPKEESYKRRGGGD
jgi:cytochrome c556